MKNIQNEKNRVSKKSVLIGTAVLLVVVGMAGYYYLQSYKNNTSPSTTSTPSTTEKKVNDINLNGPTNEQVQTGSDTKKETVNNSTPTPSTTPFVATITAANQNGSLLQIRTLIDTLSNDGVCELTLSQGTKVVVKSAGIQALSNSSTCKGFDVPVSELSSGDWKLSLKVTIGTQTSTATKTVPVS